MKYQMLVGRHRTLRTWRYNHSASGLQTRPGVLCRHFLSADAARFRHEAGVGNRATYISSQQYLELSREVAMSSMLYRHAVARYCRGILSLSGLDD